MRDAALNDIFASLHLRLFPAALRRSFHTVKIIICNNGRLIEHNRDSTSTQLVHASTISASLNTWKKGTGAQEVMCFTFPTAAATLFICLQEEPAGQNARKKTSRAVWVSSDRWGMQSKRLLSTKNVAQMEKIYNHLHNLESNLQPPQPLTVMVESLLSAVTFQQVLPLLLSDARGREEDRWPQSGDGGSGRPPVDRGPQPF